MSDLAAMWGDDPDDPPFGGWPFELSVSTYGGWHHHFATDDPRRCVSVHKPRAAVAAFVLRHVPDRLFVLFPVEEEDE